MASLGLWTGINLGKSFTMTRTDFLALALATILLPLQWQLGLF